MLDGLIMGFIPRCWFLEFGVRTNWNWSWWRCDYKVFKRCSLLCVLPRIKCLMEKIPECSTGCWWVHSRYVGWGQQVLAECGSGMPLPIVKGSTKHLRCDVPTCLHLLLLLLFTLFQGSVHCSTNSLFLLTISSAVEFMKLPGYLMVESLSHHIISWSLSCSSLHDHPPGDRQMSLGEFIIS